MVFADFRKAGDYEEIERGKRRRRLIRLGPSCAVFGHDGSKNLTRVGLMISRRRRDYRGGARLSKELSEVLTSGVEKPPPGMAALANLRLILCLDDRQNKTGEASPLRHSLRPL